ncbi:Uncharacterised protein [uncultured archaeon]|nr:Uncharacterised protein [uncultured archaeon]
MIFVGLKFPKFHPPINPTFTSASEPKTRISGSFAVTKLFRSLIRKNRWLKATRILRQRAKEEQANKVSNGGNKHTQTKGAAKGARASTIVAQKRKADLDRLNKALSDLKNEIVAGRVKPFASMESIAWHLEKNPQLKMGSVRIRGLLETEKINLSGLRVSRSEVLRRARLKS